MKREEIICFRFTGEELQRIDERMKELGIQNRSAYIRKMVMEGYCIHLDLKDIRQLVYLLQRCGNNLNQSTQNVQIPTAVFMKRTSGICRNSLEGSWRREKEFSRRSLRCGNSASTSLQSSDCSVLLKSEMEKEAEKPCWRFVLFSKSSQFRCF